MHNKNFLLNTNVMKSWIQKKGLKQCYVAEKIGMSGTAFSRMMKTGKLPVSWLTVRRIMQVTGMRRTALLVEVDHDRAD